MQFFEKYRLLISIGIGLFLNILVLFIWKYNQDRLETSLAGKVSDTGKLIVQRFEDHLRENVGQLENLKHRLEITNGEYFEYWNRDAARIVKLTNTFKFVEWIDSTMIIQRVEPYEGNEEAVGLDISRLDYRNSDWLQTRQDSVFNMTHWLELVQGDYAFLVDEPVYIDGVFHGTITAGMDFTSRFDEIMQRLNEYHVTIADENGTVFYTFGSPEGIESFGHMEISENIQIGDASRSVWSVTMVPNYLFAETNSISNNNLILVLAVVLSVLLAAGFFLTQKSVAAKRTSKTVNQKLRALIEAAPIGIYVIDSNGVVEDFWNPAAEKMLGWKQEEVLGKFLPHINSDYKEDYNKIMKEVRQKGGVSNYETVRKRRDGTERVFRLHVSHATDEGQIMVLLEDMTLEKEYEHQLKSSLDEKSILLSEIHHRVKNNLAIIIGLIELQNEEVNDGAAKSLLHETRNRIYSISGVHELLYQTENFSDISFVEYINALVNRLQQSYDDENKQVKISKSISGLRVNINQAVPLGLLLNELITNSYKHAFRDIADPRIYLKLVERNGFVEVEYEDNGDSFDAGIFNRTSTLGVTIIKTSMAQLSAEYEIFSNPGFAMRLRFPVNVKGAHSNMS